MSDAVRFLNAILGEDGAYLEIRAFGAGRTIQKFFTNAEEAADYALNLDKNGGMDVFVGMAPRDRQAGTADAVSHAYIVSADCDDAASIDALMRFPLEPSLMIASGGRDEQGRRKVHAHWWMEDKIDSNALVELKGEISRALGSDAKIVDAPRVMRMPGTTNRKPRAGKVETIKATWARVTPIQLRIASRTFKPPTDTRAADIFGTQGLDLPDIIEQGQRDDLLYKYACRLRGRGLEHDEIHALLEHMNKERVNPPLSKVDIQRIARSACKHPAGQSDEPLDIGDVDDPNAALKEAGWFLKRGSELRDERPGPPELSGLFYRARIHLLGGEPGHGKGIVAARECVEAMRRLETALYIDYEQGEEDTKLRLRQLGASEADLEERFWHVWDPTGLGKRAGLLELIIQHWNPGIIIVDAFAGALAAEGLSADSNDDVAVWEDRYAKRLTAGGACVLILDHVTKATDNRGRYTIGAQRKLALVSGASYAVDAVKKFSVGTPGEITLKCQKDRRGYFAQGQIAARISVAGTAERIELGVSYPEPTAPGEWRPTERMQSVSEFLETCGDLGASRNTIEIHVPGKADTVRTAINFLIQDGYAREETVGQERRTYFVSRYLVPSSRPRPDLVPDEVDNLVRSSPSLQGTRDEGDVEPNQHFWWKDEDDGI